MADSGHLNPWREQDGRLAFSLDGVYYFSSNKLSCDQCQTRQVNGEETLYLHSAITPVIVAPEYPHVLPYAAEFIVPQDALRNKIANSMPQTLGAAGTKKLTAVSSHFTG